MQISTLLGHVYHVARDFLDICLTMFSECVISEIQNLSTSSFFSKYLKFKLDFTNAAKHLEKVFCF